MTGLAQQSDFAAVVSLTKSSGDTKPAVDLDAMFALPEHLKEYKGAEDDRKAKTAWRHERSNEEKRLKKER